MKTLPIRLATNGSEGTIKLVRIVMEVVPEKGLGVDEMRKRFRLLDLLDGLDSEATELQMEDADAACLSECEADARWTKLSREILQFSDDVRAL